MSKYKVLIADSRHGCYEEEKSVLQKIDADVVIESSDDESRIAELVKNVDGLIVNLAPITAKVIDSMTKCKVVSRYGVGYDNVDIKALKKKGVFLANVPDYCEEDVSDHAFSLLLNCIRKISAKNNLVRQGKWNVLNDESIARICGKTFGFVGFGKIAKCLRRKLTGFNLKRILITDPYLSETDAQKAGAELVDLDTLCRESDYISLHAPLVPGTRGLIGKTQFYMMKSTAILINTSRGPLVDERALIEALENKRIAFAGLDVFESEPLEPKSVLRKCDNVVLTDHAGWYSKEAMVELKTKAAQNVVDTLIKGRPRYSVDV
jgi:D-3-phosphoglycerate dehydrogenase / 2-oxoglutarate reductase